MIMINEYFLKYVMIIINEYIQIFIDVIYFIFILNWYIDYESLL